MSVPIMFLFCMAPQPSLVHACCFTNNLRYQSPVPWQQGHSGRETWFTEAGLLPLSPTFFFSSLSALVKAPGECLHFSKLSIAYFMNTSQLLVIWKSSPPWDHLNCTHTHPSFIVTIQAEVTGNRRLGLGGRLHPQLLFLTLQAHHCKDAGKHPLQVSTLPTILVISDGLLICFKHTVNSFILPWPKLSHLESYYVQYGSHALQHIDKYTDAARQVLPRRKPVQSLNQNPFPTSLLNDTLLFFFPCYFFPLMQTVNMH